MKRKNIQLFSAAIAIVAFMASMFNPLGKDPVANFVRNQKYDVSVVLRHSDLQSMAALLKVDGEKSSMSFYFTHTTITNYQTFMNSLYGVEDETFKDKALPS